MTIDDDYQPHHWQSFMVSWMTMAMLSVSLGIPKWLGKLKPPFLEDGYPYLRETDHFLMDSFFGYPIHSWDTSIYKPSLTYNISRNMMS